MLLKGVNGITIMQPADNVQYSACQSQDSMDTKAGTHVWKPTTS